MDDIIRLTILFTFASLLFPLILKSGGKNGVGKRLVGGWVKPQKECERFRKPADTLYQWTICDEMLQQTHLLVGGTTGAGKSTLAHSIIWSLASKSPYLASFYGIDLKKVELRRWRKLPHCKGIATTPAEAIQCLDLINRLVDFRLDVMVREGLAEYDGGHVYLIIDELAELLSVDRKAVVDKLSRVMRLGRAARIHVIGFTQAPNRAKGGGLDPMLCQNFTAAVALRCRSAIESRQIVGVAGAESLPLHGTGIFWSGRGIKKIPVPMTNDRELTARVAAWA